MHDQPIRQTCHISGRRSGGQRPILFAQPLMQTVQRATHAFSHQRVDVIGLGLIEKLGDIGGRDG